MERFTTFKEAIKLVALYQATLEQMDTMKGTRLYRQNIKKMMRSLETAIEQSIRGPLSALDDTDEELMSTIQYKVEMILLRCVRARSSYFTNTSVSRSKYSLYCGIKHNDSWFLLWCNTVAWFFPKCLANVDAE